MTRRVTFGIESNGDYWKARVTLPGGARKTRSIGRKADIGKRAAMALAKAYADEEAAKLDLSPQADGQRWLDWFDQVARKRRKTATTHSTYKSTAKHLREHFDGTDKLLDLDATDAIAFREHLVRSGLQEQTVRGHCRRAKIAWAEAKAARMVMGDNPFAAVPTTVVPVDVGLEYLSLQDARKIAEAVGERQDLALMVARLAGLRLGEIKRLRWQDVNFNARVLSVRHEGARTTKRRARTVPICPELYAMLQARKQAEGYVATQVIRSGGSNMYGELRAACRIHGIECDRPYQASRKSCINDWLEILPLADVAAIAGNSPNVIMSNYHEVLASRLSKITGQTDPKSTHNPDPIATLTGRNAGQ